MPRPQPVPGRRMVISGNRLSQPVSTVTQHPQISALILDDGTVRRILTNDSLVAAMPFLAPYSSQYKEKMAGAKPRSGGCGGCGGGGSVLVQQQQGDVEYNAVRYHIVNTSADNHNKIKQALNVKQLRVYYLDPSGQRARATI